MMTDNLDRLTNEVRKLSSSEVDQLRIWLMAYHPANGETPAERRVNWSDHADRVREIFGDLPRLRENAVLALREEERF